MAYHSVQSALVILEEKKMVHEITGKQKGRVYACRPVMNSIFKT